MGGAISPYESIPELIHEIKQATYNISSNLPSPVPPMVTVNSNDLTVLINKSEKIVSILDEQEKTDFKFLVVGILSGLFFGIVGNIIVSQFIEIYNIVFPAQSNLVFWEIQLGITVTITAIACLIIFWIMRKKIKKKT